MNSIYPNRSAALTQAFNEVSPSKILIVPLDFAKKKHVVRLCDGQGQYLHKKSFPVHNDSSGIEFLLKRIQSCCKRNKIKKNHVFIACEDPHSYCIHFMHSLQYKGYKVLTVNAAEAKKYRKSSLASSDTLDLDGIANAVLNRRASSLVEPDELYSGLKRCSRNYKRYKKDITRQKNRIGKLVDELFPGFLNKKKSGVEAYSRVCLDLMSSGFSVYKIRKMNLGTLTKKMSKLHMHHSAKNAIKLKEAAANAVAPSKKVVNTLSRSLEAAIKLYKALEEVARTEEEQSAQLLVQTPYCTLLSVPGIGLVRAAAIAAELGDPLNWRSLSQMSAYAGIAPVTVQTGGPDEPPVVVGLPWKCNRRLKDALLQSAHQTALTEHRAGKYITQCKEHRLMRHYKQVLARDGKSGLSTARMILRFMRNMVLGESLYMPEDDTLEPQELAIYLTMTFEKIDDNLKGLSLKDISDEDNLITDLKKRWKSILESLCDGPIDFKI